MPTYQYACSNGHQVEAVQAFTDDPLTTCPECGAQLRKVFSAVGIVFKGSGFYRTDSRNGSGSSDDSGTEKVGADKSGSDKAGSEKSAAEKSGGSDKAGSGGSGSGSDKAASTSTTSGSSTGSTSSGSSTAKSDKNSSKVA